MAKKPTDPFPSDESFRANIPPEPADLFEADDNSAPPATDAELLDEADLFDFTEPPNAAPQAIVTPTTGDDDILAWEVLDDASSTSFVGKAQDGSGSSILGGRGALASGPGSGWLDAVVKLDSPSDVGSSPAGSGVGFGPSSSGVNLHDPDGVTDVESESSIFGRGASEQSSRVEIPLPRATGGEGEADSDDSPSIWEEELAVDAERLTARHDEPTPSDVDALKGLGRKVGHLRHDHEQPDLPPAANAPQSDMDAIKGLGAKVRQLRHDPADPDLQHTMRAARPDFDEPADEELQAWLEEETRPAPKKPASNPLSDTSAVGMSLGTKPPVPAPTSPRRPAATPVLGPEYDLEGDDDDEPVKASPKRPAAKPVAEKQKGKSSAGAWVGGGLLGLLLGGGGVFGLSQAGLLGDDTSKPVVTAPPKGTAPDGDKLAEVQKAADTAEAARAEAVKKLGDAETQFAAAKKAADKASADLIEATKKQTEAEAKWIAVGKDRDKLVLELNAAKIDFDEKKAELKTANNVLEDVRAKAKAADDVLNGLVKEFKAAKLIPEDADAATALAKLPEVAKSAATAAASGDAKKAAEALAAAKKEADLAQGALKAATDDLAKAKTDTDKALKLADDKAKEVADIQKKAKGSDDAIAALVKEFKAAKLIDPDADAATAFAKLPEAAKKAASAAMSGDAAKAAEALVAAKKEVDAAQAALKKAETELDAAKKLADAAKVDATRLVAMAKAETAQAVKTAQDEGAKAVAAAKKEADEKARDAVAKALVDVNTKLKEAEANAKTAAAQALAEAQAKVAAEAKAKAAAETLATKEAEFARQIEAAKANAPLGAPLAALDAVVEEKAMAAYSAGAAHYFAGRYADAEKQLRAAASGASDARFHYYLGLALFAQGESAAAGDSFAAGAALERRNRPNARDIGDALERIQGPARKELSKYRPN